MTMRSTMTTASTLTTLFVAVGLAMAQTPPQSPATDACGTRSADGAGTTVHATGCLERSSDVDGISAASPAGSGAATGSTPENTRTTGTPGTTGTTGSGTTSSLGTARARADEPAAMPAAPSFIATSIRPIAANCIGGSN